VSALYIFIFQRERANTGVRPYQTKEERVDSSYFLYYIGIIMRTEIKTKPSEAENAE
jgi:hypothetical protein